MQQDSYRGNIGNPPSLHRYVYVYNNPLRYTDPSGHNPVAVAAGVLGAGIAIGVELLSGLLLYLLIFLAILLILYCWADPECKRFIKCFMQFIGRAFKCLLVALDVRTVDRETCMINCIKAAWDLTTPNPTTARRTKVRAARPAEVSASVLRQVFGIMGRNIRDLMRWGNNLHLMKGPT